MIWILIIDGDNLMNRNDIKWLDFFGGVNTIIVRNKSEFNKFYNFMSDLGLQGLFHNDKTFDIQNMPLKKNPQKGRIEKAYIRSGVVVDDKTTYGRPLKNYEFAPEDFVNVKSKIRNYKKNEKKATKKEPRP